MRFKPSFFTDNLCRLSSNQKNSFAQGAIIFLGFGEEQVIESEVQNLIALGVFLGAVGYFTFGEKMDKFPDKSNHLNEKI